MVKAGMTPFVSLGPDQAKSSFCYRMFGTLHIPEGRPSRYGVPGEDPHWTEEAFYPLNLLVRKSDRIQTTDSV